jgi:hypothetical protein
MKSVQLSKKKKVSKGQPIPDLDEEPRPEQPLYGEWQTEPYKPPAAIDVPL